LDPIGISKGGTAAEAKGDAMAHKLAFIGFGTVGQGLVEIMKDKAGELKAQYGFEARVVAISDATKGSLYHPDGLDVDALLKTVRETGSLAGYPAQSGLTRGWDSLVTIENSNADTVVEVAWTDLKTGQPAIDHLRAAFKTGKNVVTSNKGPAALAYHELRGLAEANGVEWGIEGTVMSGTPALRLARTALAGCHISEIRGILNGTTNFILTQMEAGASYADALADAQRLGYAEADPTADVEGHDALGKLLILSAVVMDAPLKADQIACQGISHLTLDDVRRAQAEGKRWKLIAQLRRAGDQLEASVGPQAIPASGALAGVGGATNAMTYVTDLLGEVTLVGPGAGRRETGFALLADLLDIQRSTKP
jgi:homoserine dehydrogenase